MIDDTTHFAELSAELFADLIAQLDDRTFRADITSREAFAAMQQLIVLRNMLDHYAATLTGEFDRLKMTAPQGRSVRQLLITMGIAPAVAGRLVRVGTATDIDGLRTHTVDGAISLDHADAIVLGLG
ncbi:HNH endonuclease, partial [Gordonia sp. DT219]